LYSSEWFWAKAAWVAEQDAGLVPYIHSWVELCYWVPALLAGCQHPTNLRRGICAAGYKAMWHESWGGLPSQDFLSAISPTLDGMRDRMFTEVYTSDQLAGHLSTEWAQRLGLPEGIAIAIGAFDCHMGAVGAGAGEHDLVKVIGTSTCDILMVDAQSIGDRTIHGICGQVTGSAMPDLMALEAGQSAFGDIYHFGVKPPH
jgi:L-ribulokinase